MGELGVEEISGEEDNPRIEAYPSESGINEITSDEVPWCSTFNNWCAKQANLQQSGKANARSWLNVGRKTEHPEPGDIAVFWRESPQSWKGHVGVFLGFSEDLSRVYVVGGNQGNRVSVSAYQRDTVLSFQRLTESENITIPEPTLSQGDRGKLIVQLQNCLKYIGIEVGTSDGIYGDKTRDGVIELQTRQDGLEIDGVTDPIQGIFWYH